MPAVHAFLHALGFLTRIPLTRRYAYRREYAGAAVAWYGVVGLCIGLVLAGGALLGAAALPPSLTGVLLVALWLGLTGAMHLDGVADCADAWMGGLQPARMLEIMRDRDCGVGAITAIVLICLIKSTALTALLTAHDAWTVALWLLFPPTIARLALGWFIRYVPYLRTHGAGRPLQGTIKTPALTIATLTIATPLALISPPLLITTLIATALAYTLIHQTFLTRLGGATGDIYGAFVEVTETLILVAIVFWGR